MLCLSLAASAMVLNELLTLLVLFPIVNMRRTPKPKSQTKSSSLACHDVKCCPTVIYSYRPCQFALIALYHAISPSISASCSKSKLAVGVATMLLPFRSRALPGLRQAQSRLALRSGWICSSCRTTPAAVQRWSSSQSSAGSSSEKPYYITTPIFYVNAGKYTWSLMSFPNGVTNMLFKKLHILVIYIPWSWRMSSSVGSRLKVKKRFCAREQMSME